MLRNGMVRRKFGRRFLSVTLCLLMSISVLTATAAGAGDGLTTEQPVLVVTGQGLPEGARGSADSVSNEKAYTLDELRALDGVAVERVYSSINRFETKIFYRGQGVDLESILALSGYTDKGRVTVVSNDGYSQPYSMDADRYFYPNLAEADESGAELVKAMLAWKSASITSEDEQLTIPDPFAQNEDADDTSMLLLVGQTNVSDINSQLYARWVNKLVAGDAIDDVDITVFGEELTRADILLMPRAERTYEYTSRGGEQTDTVRGVPIADLLAEVRDDVVIKFQTVDNWNASAYTMTKSELVAKNAILAYEVNGETYYRPDEAGYFRLMVDGMSGVHSVNNISSYFEPDSSPDYNQGEIFAALNAGLVPDSIAQAGWQNNTSRLAAADAIVALIEAVSEKTMEELAQEKGWDLTTGGFSDTDSTAVTFLKYAEVTTGKDAVNNLYAPNDYYNRAEIVTMIGRTAKNIFGIETEGENPFTDVADNYVWAAPFVGYAAENNITTGIGEGLFNPSGRLQNQHTALFMIRTFNAWK